VALIELDWQVMWCPRHLEPYRPAWPAGAATAVTKLFQAAAAMPVIADDAHGDVAQLPAALGTVAPVCCFVGQQVLDEIYAATLPPAT
jgi:hypothetical protein